MQHAGLGSLQVRQGSSQGPTPLPEGRPWGYGLRLCDDAAACAQITGLLPVALAALKRHDMRG
eukprot:CAMPEP_0174372826 /NCGR_PEP_ID=MMETSP0811_2-20130205/104826_1 /TAXON_ID=73025 ORGANISM="Eutreptiella gymnastica-like, Strain CCMP1594" /NCGR_SAMPLE_ID=MMETSP0811_2 /ASSEMBLY_ACC=CAM_ASM_000667 /LENGTH=62 /DNA_ID=CAMNT_0015520555 /DNA_START=567 /DNA_END=756 /DNA_ORIENTATION=-